jgi:hypothetical protein
LCFIRIEAVFKRSHPRYFLAYAFNCQGAWEILPLPKEGTPLSSPA